MKLSNCVMFSFANESRPRRETDVLLRHRQSSHPPTWPQLSGASAAQRLLPYMSVVWPRPRQASLVWPTRMNCTQRDLEAGGGGQRRSQCKRLELTACRVLRVTITKHKELSAPGNQGLTGNWRTCTIRETYLAPLTF